jgi:hypothetical protein
MERKTLSMSRNTFEDRYMRRIAKLEKASLVRSAWKLLFTRRNFS